MKNASIYGKKWLDLVFEGKNKEYGAYRLRQEDSKNTLKAFFAASMLISTLFAGFMFLTSFGDKPNEVVIAYKLRPVSPALFEVKLKKEPIQKSASVKTSSETTQKKRAYIPTKTMPDLPEVPTNNLNATAQPTNSGTASGTLPDDGSTGGNESGSTKPIFNGIASSAELDKQPNFPGGMNRFYDYVGKNFQKTAVEDETNNIKVLISFVIEPDGSMTDIKVLRSSNPIVNDEAIRVLKSLQTKWEAGIKDGQAVRTRFTLPITVQAE